MSTHNPLPQTINQPIADISPVVDKINILYAIWEIKHFYMFITSYLYMNFC